MKTQAQRWREQTRASRDMGLTVAEWRALIARRPTVYGWADSFIAGADSAAPVAPILAKAIRLNL